MMVELQRLIEFKVGWFESDRSREWMEFEPITINTEYIATLRRYEIFAGEGKPKHQFCSVWMVDQGNNFTVDKTYEEMRDLIMRKR